MIAHLLAGLLSLLALPAAAQSVEVGAGTRDFSLGMNELFEPSKMEPGYSPDLLNVMLDEKVGVLTPRTGYTLCGITPSGNPATRIYEYVKTNGTRKLIVSDNVTVWETSDCSAFTEIVDDLADNVPDFATIRDDLWIVNRSTHALVWDGTTLTTLDARSGTPNPAPPACAYLEFWRERVWCARTSDNPSDLAFSALTDSAGNDITPSTGSAAWPATNVFAVDEDGGCPIYGIKAYKDALYVFKGECGIFRIDFENDYNNAIRKTFASVGAKFHTGIVEGDGLLHFVGPDGIYVTDMQQFLVRISDVIPDTFDNLRQPNAGETLSVWTSQADFENGTNSNMTTVQTPGSVELSTNTAAIDNGGFETGDFSNFTSTCTGNASVAIISDASTPVGTYNGHLYTRDSAESNNCSASINIVVSGSTVTQLVNGDITDGTSTHTLNTNSWLGQTAYLTFYANDNTTGDQCTLTSDPFTLGTQVTLIANSACRPSVAGNGIGRIDNILNHTFYSSGTYVSEVRNYSETISEHSTFDADDDTNGGTISYEVRLGTDSGGVESSAFYSIDPGDTIVAASSVTYFQWRATYVHAAPGPARTNSVTFNALTGDLTDAPIYAAFHDNRFWVSGASGTSTTNNIVLVKSKNPSNAITRFDLKINDMAKFNDNFYAAASTHSAIYRLDNGTNDNGDAITWYWTSKEFDFDSPYVKKKLKEIIYDYRNGSANNLNVGYKRNDQDTYTYSSTIANSTGRGTRRVFINGGLSHGFQLRVIDTTKDETAEVVGVGAFAIPGRIRE